MPELPEVETVMRGLEPALLGQRVARLVLNRPDLRVPITPSLPQDLRGQIVQYMQRRGKYILGFSESGNGFVLHLGMSGVIKVLLPEDDYEPAKHDHVVFEMEDGGRVVFNDARRFGFLIAAEQGGWQMQAPFDKMGPEPLGNAFSGDVLYDSLKCKKSPIKNALLDQRVVAGLGNIYVCEALYRACVDPRRIACSLDEGECTALVTVIKDVLNEAIEAGGSSLRDYRNAKGKMGYFQHHFSVYDREGDACPDCSCDLNNGGGVKRIVQGGRSTFFCEHLQK